MDRLAPGASLSPDESLASSTGVVRLVMQSDGNLVLYSDRPSGQRALWSTDTWGQEALSCTMQSDGNLALNGSAGPLWTSGTASPGAYLLVQDDENLVIYDSSDGAVWATNTSVDGTPVKGSAPEVYFLFAGVLHHIPDEETLVGSYGGWEAVSVLSDTQLNVWPVGEPIPSMRPRVDRLCLSEPIGVQHEPRPLPPPPPPKIQPDGSVVGVVQQPLAGTTDLMLPTGTVVNVSFVDLTPPEVRRQIRDFAQEWSQYANINLNFVDSNQHGYIRIAVHDDPTGGGGGSSAVGRDAEQYAADEATVNLNIGAATTDETIKRNVLHEFGHALGLQHEHQSPAAGIDWNRSAVYEFYARGPDPWSREQVDRNIFDKLDAKTTNYSDFDPDSIMCYDIPANLINSGEAHEASGVLSDTDKNYIGQWYPYAPTPANAAGLLRLANDRIAFACNYGVVDDDQIRFNLSLRKPITWWKAIEIPIQNGKWRMLQLQDKEPIQTVTLNFDDLDRSRPIQFWKAMVFGVHSKMGEAWPVSHAFIGGMDIHLGWEKD